MATSKVAQKRLAREYLNIVENPPPYISAHPSDSNILEWHYIITGPEDTPYHRGQYWGTLTFPPTYPYAPPAIRMHTPSGRFQPSSRLCLSISDFHPKSFNPAWSVSTILIGLLSFMTSDEMTTGSIAGSTAERKYYASRSRWWNSTGGGSQQGHMNEGNVRAGDGGAKFRSEWPEIYTANREWMTARHVDLLTGAMAPAAAESASAAASSGGLCRPAIAGTGVAGKMVGVAGSGDRPQAVVDRVFQQREAGRGFLSRNKLLVAGAAIFFYVMLVRLVRGS